MRERQQAAQHILAPVSVQLDHGGYVDTDGALVLPGVRLTSLANVSTRRHWSAGTKEKRRMQTRLAQALRELLPRPDLPCVVRMVRVAPGKLDSDNLVGAHKYVRDSIARWAHGLDETIPARDKAGRPIINKRGVLKMTRPAAPDGPKDGIRWVCEQRSEGRGVYAVRVYVEQEGAA